MSPRSCGFHPSVVRVFALEAEQSIDAERITALVEEVSRASDAFAAMWRDHDVRNFGEGTKLMRNPIAGLISFDYASFAVGGRPDLALVIFTPATPADAERIKSLLAA